MKTVAIAMLTAFTIAAALPACADPIPDQFASIGKDRSAIDTLLTTYTTAVTTKNQSMFESLLLNKDIPFSGVGEQDRSNGQRVITSNYDSFRKGVFQGPAFTQRFQDIHINQDGRLASVSLVFVNTGANVVNWGWKTIALLKIHGRWKIASEFYTGHPG